MAIRAQLWLVGQLLGNLFLRYAMSRLVRALAGLIGFIALPFGDTAARLALWLKGYRSGHER